MYVEHKNYDFFSIKYVIIYIILEYFILINLFFSYFHQSVSLASGPNRCLVSKMLLN